jgi:hypothetical protein
MKALIGYGAAARPAVPALKDLIVYFNTECKEGRFPQGPLNKRRIDAVQEAIKAIEAAKDQPQLRSIAPTPPKGGSNK